MFSIDEKKNFKFDITPTQKMVPKAHIILFYVTEKGELISDKITVEFEKELSNYVSL
jgi:Alpha-2-macroglobulin bait region domain